MLIESIWYHLQPRTLLKKTASMRSFMYMIKERVPRYFLAIHQIPPGEGENYYCELISVGDVSSEPGPDFTTDVK